MDLPIARHNIETKIGTIKKHIKYALDDAEDGSETAEILDQLLDRMDNGTDDPSSVVPNRIAGDLSLKEELTYLNNLTLTKGNMYV